MSLIVIPSALSNRLWARARARGAGSWVIVCSRRSRWVSSRGWTYRTVGTLSFGVASETKVWITWYTGGYYAKKLLVRHLVSGAPARVAITRRIGHETAGFDKRSRPVYRRQPTLCREVDQPCVVLCGAWRECQDDEAIRMPLARRSERARELVEPTHLQGVHLETQPAGRLLRVPQLPENAGFHGIPEDRDARHPGDRVLEDLQPLPAEVPCQGTHARDVAAWPPQTGHEPIPNGINVSRHDNGDRTRHLFGGPCRFWPPSDNDVDPEPV